MNDDATPAPSDPDWSPEKEAEEDPSKLQKEGIKLMREALKTMNDARAKHSDHQEAINRSKAELAALQAHPSVRLAPNIRAYEPPLLSDLLVNLESLWSAICAKFTESAIRICVFETLAHVPFRLTPTPEAPPPVAPNDTSPSIVLPGNTKPVFTSDLEPLATFPGPASFFVPGQHQPPVSAPAPVPTLYTVLHPDDSVCPFGITSADGDAVFKAANALDAKETRSACVVTRHFPRPVKKASP